MKKIEAKSGDFIEITERKISEKIQPNIKVGQVYNINRVERLKSGATVLVVDSHDNDGKTYRCNAERFGWEVITPEQIQERNFKEQCKADALALVDNFSLKEHGQIAFAPLIIAEVAWIYAFKVLKFCADNRIEEVKKLSRAVKALREKYIETLSEDLDRAHLDDILSKAEEFLQENAFDFQLMYYSTCNAINYQFIGIEYDSMRTHAYLSSLFCEEVRSHEDRMTEFIRKRLGKATEGHLPYLDTLSTCMEAYLGNITVNKTREIETGLSVFRKNISKIEFING